MDGLILWCRLEARSKPFSPKAGLGRRPYPLGTIRRGQCVQLFDNLSAPGLEALLDEGESGCRSAGVRRSGARPDEMTILHCRRRVERPYSRRATRPWPRGAAAGLPAQICAHSNAPLAARGRRLPTGTRGDAEGQAGTLRQEAA